MMLDMKAPFVAVLLLISVVSAHSASQKNVSEGPVLKQLVVRVPKWNGQWTDKTSNFGDAARK